MKGNARLLTRPRMSQTRPPFRPGTDEYRRWRNVVHINGELCDILRHICEKEDKDPSLRRKLDDVKAKLRSLRDSLDYYDGEGHTEFGQPMDIVRVPTSTFEMDEYSGISSSSSSEYEIIDERPYGPRKPSRPTSTRGNEAVPGQSRWLQTAGPPGSGRDEIQWLEFNPQDSEEEEEEKRTRTRAEKKHTVWFRDPNKPDFPVIMYRYSYSSDSEDGRWEGPR